MEFILTGFRHDKNVRHFAFDGVSADRKHTAFSVGADLALIRKYQIAMQELPLLCRQLLEQRPEFEQAHSFTFSEDAMRVHATARAAATAEAVRKRKTPRPVPSNGVNRTWGRPLP